MHIARYIAKIKTFSMPFSYSLWLQYLNIFCIIEKAPDQTNAAVVFIEFTSADANQTGRFLNER